METLASVWARDPRDLSDLGETSQTSVWDSQSLFNTSTPAGLMWTDQLSPHLQRNKQLQDTLLQREEELARLHEENIKLKEFLNSSFVRNLQQKAKKLSADGRRKLKRNLTSVDDGPSQTFQHVSKRVCRNLTAEFCSESSETASSSEPNLDLWVLRTLGLKDKDTIDTSSDSSTSSPDLSLVYDAAITSSLSSSLSPSVVTSTPSSVHGYNLKSTHQTDYSAVQYHEANCCNSAGSPQNCSNPPGQRCVLTTSAPPGPYEGPEAVIRSYNTLTAFQSPPLTEELPFTWSPDRVSRRVQTLEKDPAYWSPLTPSQDNIHLSPPADRVPFSPILSSSPVLNQLWTPVRGGSPVSPSVGSQTPRSRTDLAFTMSLSPSSSVKTHSFPQGQAFIRKDTGGRWNFTWVPRQGP
ncbi:geminin coiled-coil domain-containing protein 1 [Larimichthys crocea]|uniref:geminin coiled-coil domain-containing protein 1 n=1 Tax=Larimichthys crocea TaxID=215358 RepID=UPI000F5EA3D5|nr:geminin coiled-coil domain-containing protein 1 [Larimichthys crocea]